MAELFGMLPDVTTLKRLRFDDVAAVKDAAGAKNLVGERGKRALETFSRTLSNSVFVTEDLSEFDDHTRWGWTFVDVVWRADLTFEGEPEDLTIIKLRPDLDLSVIRAHYRQLGFTMSRYQEAEEFEHSSPNLAILAGYYSFRQLYGSAILEDANILVLSTNRRLRHEVIDAIAGRRQSVVPAALQETALGLGAVQSADIYLGREVCMPFDPANAVLGDIITEERLDAESIEERVQQGRRQLAGLNVYDTLGIGALHTGPETQGSYVLHYPAAAQARTDQQRRSLLVDDLEGEFTVSEAQVSGRNLVFTLTEPKRGYAPPFVKFNNRELTFLACPT